jgi:tetratricopeptide (TPR) repeat protein
MDMIERLEAMVRAGESAKAARAIRAVSGKSVARKDLARLAQIANRLGLASLSLRWLHPVVRSDSPAIARPSGAEKLEYAAALRLHGLFREAIALLNEIDPAQMPLVHLRKASCLISQWKYDEAIPSLKNFLSGSDPKDYSQVIAKVNLAASLLFENLDGEAADLLERLVAETKEAGHHLLHGNSLELTAQLRIRRGQFAQAQEALSAAAPFLAGHGRYALYLRKWAAIADSLKAGEVRPELLKVRAEAVSEREWETQRECDLYIGMLSRDHALINHVYIGTPFVSYRKRVRRLAPGFLPAENLFWTSEPGRLPAKVFDVVAGEGLDQGRLPHRALIYLASDFYRPVTLGGAFAELFPGENYSQEGHTDRVHQAIRKLRAWFAAEGHDIGISVSRGFYRLEFAPEVGLLVPRDKPALESEPVRWHKFARQWGRARFRKRDLMERLGCSNASAKRLLKWAVEAGEARVSGLNRGRSYTISKAS